jgi:predicted RNA-binding protein YlqC (UPF0109 family)
MNEINEKTEEKFEIDTTGSLAQYFESDSNEIKELTEAVKLQDGVKEELVKEGVSVRKRSVDEEIHSINFKKMKPLPKPSPPNHPPPEHVTSYYSAPTSNVGIKKPSSSIGPEADIDMQVNMRFLISSKEAGILIGKAGCHVAEIRESTGMRVIVSPQAPRVNDRIMTLTGQLQALGRAISMIAKKLITSLKDGKDKATLRMLIPSPKMGYVIGKSGSRIKELQADSGCLIFSEAENLPNTSERVMSLIGTPESLQIASYTLGSFIGDFVDTSSTFTYYDPSILEKPIEQTLYSPTPNHNSTSSQSMFQNIAQLQMLASQYQQYINGAMPAPIDPPRSASIDSSTYFAQPQKYPIQTSNFAQPQTYSMPSPSTPASYLPDYSQQQFNPAVLAYYQQIAQMGIGQQMQQPFNVGMSKTQTSSVMSQIPSNPNQSFQNYVQELMVPSHLVGNIIGKGGANIKEIRSTSNCEVILINEGYFCR